MTRSGGGLTARQSAPAPGADGSCRPSGHQMCLEWLMAKWRAWRRPAPVAPAASPVEPPPASVFDTFERTLQGGHPHVMSQFAYLNQSARTEAERVRAKVDELYSHYPACHRAALRNRLRSIDDVTHYGVLFELAMHELLIRAGCRIVAVEPPMPGTNKSPDFLVEAPDGRRFYFEATIATGQSQATAGARKRLDEVYKAINSVPSGFSPECRDRRNAEPIGSAQQAQVRHKALAENP
jgi:hypothetical protein